jgi:hypothetical protein
VVGHLLLSRRGRLLALLLAFLRLRGDQRQRPDRQRLAHRRRIRVGDRDRPPLDGSDDDNQVAYFATGYDPRTGAVLGARPNAGSLLGIRYVEGRGAHARVGFAWLRAWPHEQRYLSPAAPVVVTTYAAPLSLGLVVTDTDFATPGTLHDLDPAVTPGGPDAFVRDVTVERGPGSPVTSAELVAYANWSPIASDVPYVPFQDAGCSEQLNATKLGSYDPASGVATVTWSGVDLATGEPSSAVVAMGFQRPAGSYEVGTDSENPLAPPGPPDAFTELASPPYTLGDSEAAAGQVTVALAEPLFFDRSGVARESLVTAVAPSRGAAVAQVLGLRRAGITAELRAVLHAWRTIFRKVPLPSTTDPRVRAVASLSVITMLLAVDPRTGAVIASAATQGPYGEDWPRDGSFIDAGLDAAGFTSLATAHALFYVRTQSSPHHPLPGVPFGNWPMNMYPTGQPGGPIPYEIDETGYGTWTIVRQARFLPRPERHAYLARVFPAVARAATWLTVCADPTNGFQCPASEDDNVTPSQTLHGALPDLLALRSAIAAAAALHIASPTVALWRARAAQLQAAIARLYSPRAHAYREGPSSTTALPVSYEDGGLMLWPTRFLPYSDPRMQGEADATFSAMQASFSGRAGDYEGVALLGLCHAWRHDRAKTRLLRHTLAYMAESLTTPTGLFGEGWVRWGDGTIGPLNDQPHVWEHALFYLFSISRPSASTHPRRASPSRAAPRPHVVVGLPPVRATPRPAVLDLRRAMTLRAGRDPG